MSFENEKAANSSLKTTKQRTAILEILEKQGQPVCAEEIYDELKKRGISISLSTVYRALERMTEKRITLKLVLGDGGKALFELNRELHKHYLVCVECKRIISIISCPLESYEEKLAAETGFLIEGHSLTVYGVCPECRNAVGQS